MPKRIKKLSLASMEINELPSNLVMGILLKLPVKTLLQSKSVCKSWYDLISSRYFATSYLANLPFHTFVISESRGDQTGFDTLSLVEIGRNGDVSCTRFGPQTVHYPKSGFLEMEGSCNGLVCFVLSPKLEYNDDVISYCFNLYRDEIVYVLNPLSRKHIELPCGTADLCHILGVRYGFGSSMSDNCCKVVRISRGFDNNHEHKVNCDIFIIWEDVGWRSIQDPSIPMEIYTSGISVNGFLNWVGVDENYSCYIYAFDIGKEIGHRMLLPPELEAQFTREAACDLGLTVWDNNLCLIDFMCEV